MEKNAFTPILVPYEPEEFWNKFRAIIREEVKNSEKIYEKQGTYQTNGLTYKPLFKIDEVCSIFRVSRPTIYDWIKHGKLKPYKVRSRLYFLWNDVQEMIHIAH